VTILPGRTIGLLGGGQLGRMFAICARRMGYRVHAFDPTADCPAGQVADVEVNAPYEDVAAALDFARKVDVVTFEFENVPAETLEAVAGVVPVHPSPLVLDTCRHRVREKAFLVRNHFPLAAFVAVDGPAALAEATRAVGLPAILKSADYGYDGKGQVRIEAGDDLAAAWARMGGQSGVVEALVRFEREISVLVARGADGEVVVYPPAENRHERHILDVSVVPARIPPELARKAEALAIDIARALDLRGLLCVELFVVDGDLLVNELAPRPHNSGHWTFDAAVTSQFEQQLRAVCGLPLGDPSLLAPAVAMANLLGDLWDEAAGEPDWAAALAEPRIKLHLYGKAEARPGRKMGHLTATGADGAEAEGLVRIARQRLVRPDSR
jgi:5-(carboxyamino)imidazole ribonucleotide synthase